jgi:hypothetical protein
MSSAQGSTTVGKKRSFELQIVNWPLRDDPWYAGGILLICLAIGGFAGWISGSLHMGALGVLALMSTVWKLWIPMNCHIDSSGITVGVLRWQRRIAWREIDHLESRPHGIIITALNRQNHLPMLGRIYFPWSGNEEAVSKICSHYRALFGRVEVVTHDHDS